MILYIDLERMETRENPRTEVLIEIGIWLGQQGILPTKVQKELFDPTLLLEVTDEEALVIKMRFPLASQEQVNRNYSEYMQSAAHQTIKGASIVANTIQANTITMGTLKNLSGLHRRAKGTS